MRLRRSASLAAIALVVPLAATAASQNVADLRSGHYVLDPRHSSLIARVSHMGVSLYTLRFDALSATFDYDAAHPQAAKVQASVDPASLDVGADYSKAFAQEFLSVDKFPAATFVSTDVHEGAGDAGTMTGDLTLMGVTRPVTFDVTFVGAGHEPLPLPFGQEAAGFTAVATIKRSDFGSVFLSNFVGDDVTLEIDAEFDRK
ncbi:MAG TPA: YceI family protein [Caulobacteraceae bacterium]|nr:YceI family protein [Caulobacteraceae bacterium]